jgi:hypothetical protein
VNDGDSSDKMLQRQRCGRRPATGSCGPPRTNGGAGGAQTAAGNGELIRLEAATEEVLVLEVRAVGSTLERLLDVAAETTVLRAGSDGNRGGPWWHSLAISDGRVTEEGKTRERT